MTSDDDILNEDGHFSTDDIALAVALALAYPLAAVNRDDPHGMRFVFRRHATLAELVEQYRCGELQVEPRAYAERLHRLEAQYFGDIE